MNNGLKPFVKWAGGKTQLLKQFKSYFPKKIDRYLEPFVGSGAVFFYVKQKYNPKEVILSDSNEELINCYQQIQRNFPRLLGHLKNYEDNFLQFSYEEELEQRKNFYYSVRAKKHSSKIQRAARFLFLNRTCFNGLYRVNPKGEFNVPIGQYKNPTILTLDTLTKAKELLKGVKVERRPFEHVSNEAEKGDFVYLDPPYYPLTETSYFTNYTKEVFHKEEQEQLAQVFDELDKKGCRLMLSNNDSPFIRKLYKKGKSSVKRRKEVRATRLINCDATKRGAINELLVMNY